MNCLIFKFTNTLRRCGAVVVCCFSNKRMSLDNFDMHFVFVDIFCQYLANLAKVTMGDLRKKVDLSTEKIL